MRAPSASSSDAAASTARCSTSAGSWSDGQATGDLPERPLHLDAPSELAPRLRELPDGILGVQHIGVDVGGSGHVGEDTRAAGCGPLGRPSTWLHTG